MPGRLALFWRSYAENRGAVVGLVLMAALIVISALADVLSLHSPIEQFRQHFLIPPIWQDGGLWEFPLGTDDVGRDMLSRLIHGARLSIIIGFSVASLASELVDIMGGRSELGRVLRLAAGKPACTEPPGSILASDTFVASLVRGSTSTLRVGG
jgi:ABC-type antimicrobial peptide transport system permease subunit